MLHFLRDNVLLLAVSKPQTGIRLKNYKDSEVKE